MAGLRVSVADNGQVALDMIEANSYDAVLMDVQMPVMDGYTATRLLREKEEYADLPIIAMTANAMTKDIESCLEAGMNAHVAKPIDPHQLFRTLTEWVPEGIREPIATLPDEDETVADAPEMDLPGFDTTSALARCGGSQQIYRKLLAKVSDSEADVITRIQSHLDDGDMQSAVRAAHTLKGVAGNVGAGELSALAGRMEHALQNISSWRDCDQPQRDEIQQLTREVSEELLRTLQIIEAALAATAAVSKADSAGNEPAGLTAEQLEQRLSLLAEAIDNFDSSSAEQVEELLELVNDNRVAQTLNTLRAALEAYDFDQAQTLVTSIRAES